MKILSRLAFSGCLRNPRFVGIVVAIVASLQAFAKPDRQPVPPRDWPMFGGGPGRNMVNLQNLKLPAEWSVEEDKYHNIKWTVDLGTRSYFTAPVIADGMVFVPTNNRQPRDIRIG